MKKYIKYTFKEMESFFPKMEEDVIYVVEKTNHLDQYEIVGVFYQLWLAMLFKDALVRTRAYGYHCNCFEKINGKVVVATYAHPVGNEVVDFFEAFRRGEASITNRLTNTI